MNAETIQTKNLIEKQPKLLSFLNENVSDVVPSMGSTSLAEGSSTKLDILADVEEGMKAAPMAVRLTPYILSRIDWTDPFNDPLRRQFIPIRSSMIPDHELAQLDSLNEAHDSPVKNIVHRYPDKVLFLGTYDLPLEHLQQR